MATEASFWGPRGRPDGSAELVSELCGSPDWSASSDELHVKIAERFAAGQRLQAVVGGPHRATPHMLRHLAHTAQWQVVEAPTPADIPERRSDLTVRGKAALLQLGVAPAAAPTP